MSDNKNPNHEAARARKSPASSDYQPGETCPGKTLEQSREDG